MNDSLLYLVSIASVIYVIGFLASLVRDKHLAFDAGVRLSLLKALFFAFAWPVLMFSAVLYLLHRDLEDARSYRRSQSARAKKVS
ncbi:MAG TPA: hypothetical protein VHA33_29315 [Candidatus Angelobacter sp.]|jgi:hypothetical protein|nr:hypothetical protein [Candidatus Angelobacter sp.]